MFSPTSGQSPVDLAKLSLERSRKLLEQARLLVGTLAQLKRELQIEEKKMESVERTLFKITEEVNNMNWSLDNTVTGENLGN